jgi:hypothetical protein
MSTHTYEPIILPTYLSPTNLQTYINLLQFTYLPTYFCQVTTYYLILVSKLNTCIDLNLAHVICQNVTLQS